MKLNRKLRIYSNSLLFFLATAVNRLVRYSGGLVILSMPLLFCITTGCSNQSEKTPGKPNILFIIVDDLRPELPSYGKAEVYAPAMEDLAERGMVFENAYCQYPVCGPSRCSLLSGLRPTRNRFTSNSALVDIDAPDITQLPRLFKENGYYTISNGKVYHDQGNVIDGMDGWSEIPWEPHPGFWVWLDSANMKHNYQGYRYRQQTVSNMGPAWEAMDVEDNAYPTGVVTDKSIQDLERLAEQEQPFFLAVGYRKPHLPLNAPLKYWKLYDSTDFALPENFSTERNLADPLKIRNGELRNYGNIPSNGEISKQDWLTLIHGYHACISYTDAQIGKLIGALERLGFSENTIIVMVGDHGYHLAEYGIWGKNNPLQLSLKAPMIITVPWLKEKRGRSGELVEFVDIYPTLAELCGLEMPEHLAGSSLKNLLTGSQHSIGKEAVFSRVGHAEIIVTNKYAYTEWLDDAGSTYGQMLFDHSRDPDEQNNVAGNPNYERVIDSLSTVLHQHLRTRK